MKLSEVTMSFWVAWLLCAALCGICAGSDAELVLVSPHWEGVRYEFEEAFQRWYRQQMDAEVDLKWLDVGGTSDIVRFIRSEFKSKPEGIGVDLLFGGGTDPFEELKRQSLLQPCRLPEEIAGALTAEINGVPLSDSEGRWYAAAMAGFGIIYNRVVLNRLGLPEPQTWKDLANPALQSWVGSADPRKSGSVHVMYEIILQGYGWERGWEIITALGGNVRGFTAAGSQTPQDVALGEVAYGLAIDSYAWAQQRQSGHDVIGYVMPEDVSVYTGDSIAVLKGAPHLATAQAFVAFVLSEAGQKLWLLRKGDPEGPKRFELGKFSVLPHLYGQVGERAAVPVNPFAVRSQLRYDAEKGSVRWEIVNDLIGSQIIDPHDLLVRAWRGAITRGEVHSELLRLAVVPVTEEQAEQLGRSGAWQDARVRNKTTQEWARLGWEKYGTESGSRLVLRSAPALLALVVGAGMVAYMRKRRAA